MSKVYVALVPLCDTGIVIKRGTEQILRDKLFLPEMFFFQRSLFVPNALMLQAQNYLHAPDTHLRILYTCPGNPRADSGPG